MSEEQQMRDDEEIQPETPNPRSPAEQRRDNPEELDKYIETHGEAAKDSRSE